MIKSDNDNATGGCMSNPTPTEIFKVQSHQIPSAVSSTNEVEGVGDNVMDERFSYD
jgi:hypothetical protein